MKTTHVVLILACTGCLARPCPAGQTAAEKAPVLAVCKVLADPLKYNGRLITIRGRRAATDEGSSLIGSDCPGAVTTDGYRWPSAIWLAMPTVSPTQRLHTPDFEFDWEAWQRLDEKYNRLYKTTPDACLLFTVTGLFESRTDWPLHTAVYPNGTWKYIGFGHLGSSPAQLLVKSKDDVDAIPGCSAGQGQPAAVPNDK